MTVSHLSVALSDGRELLHDVSFAVPSGATTVLLGANGAGKSTLASSLVGDPRFSASGEAKFLGQDLLSITPDQRARLGIFMTFQNPVEIPGVSATEVIRSALEAQKGDFVSLDSVRAGITEAASQLDTNIWFAERDLNVGFSGGEKKLGEVLQLLSLEPKFVILDEIDSGLDVDASARISSVLRDYQARTGCTYLVITHNMRVLRDLRPARAVLLAKGRVAAVGGEELVSAVEKQGYRGALAKATPIDAPVRKADA